MMMDIGKDLQAAFDDGYKARDAEIVRCADCKWFDISEPSGTVEPIGYICHRKYIFVESDDFCKRGERRENETSKR